MNYMGFCYTAYCFNQAFVLQDFNKRIHSFIHSFIHSLIQGTGIESFPDEIPKHATAADASAATSNEPPRYRR